MDQNECQGTGGASRRETRLYLARLRGLAERLDHRAALIRNGGYNTQAEHQAGTLCDDAFAIRWALRQLAPETECITQVFAALGHAGRQSRP